MVIVIFNSDSNVILTGYMWPSVNTKFTSLPALCTLATILVTIITLRRCVGLWMIWTDVQIVYHQNLDTVLATQNIGYSKLTAWLHMGLHFGISTIHQLRIFGSIYRLPYTTHGYLLPGVCNDKTVTTQLIPGSWNSSRLVTNQITTLSNCVVGVFEKKSEKIPK